jgi:hypothetical protein
VVYYADVGASEAGMESYNPIKKLQAKSRCWIRNWYGRFIVEQNTVSDFWMICIAYGEEHGHFHLQHNVRSRQLYRRDDRERAGQNVRQAGCPVV